MFWIICDPSSGSIELYVIEIIRSGSQMFVVCFVGVWQHNFEPVVCVCVRYDGLGTSSQPVVLPDDGSHTIRNMLEWFLILCLSNFYTT